MSSGSDPRTAQRKPSPAVAQAAAILRLLASAGEPAGVTAIARETGISPSSCFNLLRTLVGEGLLDFDDSRKLYSLGLGVLQLARGALGRDAILKAARPVLDALSKEYHATVGLWRAGNRMTLIALGESTASTRIHMEVGQRQPLGAGATGRAWLAASQRTKGEVEELFAQIRWQRPVTLAQYLASIEAARAIGFAEDAELLNSGIVSVASPIRAYAGSGDPSHVLSASLFAGSTDDERLRALGCALAQAAGRLERDATG